MKKKKYKITYFSMGQIHEEVVELNKRELKKCKNNNRYKIELIKS